MDTGFLAISVSSMLWIVPLVACVLWIHWQWSMDVRSPAWGLFRMVVQLLIVGYLLHYIFNADHAIIVLIVMVVMMLVASWIALRPLQKQSPRVYVNALIAISLSGAVTLFVVTQAVLAVKPWYQPQYVVPIAGMIFANAMNAVSLAAERYEFGLAQGREALALRSEALNAAMIPVVNSLFAVGIVALPGMMTGQILAGVSPMIAVRYQILVMAMIFASAGIAAALFLWLTQRKR